MQLPECMWRFFYADYIPFHEWDIFTLPRLSGPVEMVWLLHFGSSEKILQEFLKKHPVCAFWRVTGSLLFLGLISAWQFKSSRHREVSYCGMIADKLSRASEGSCVLALPPWENALCILLCACISTCRYVLCLNIFWDWLTFWIQTTPYLDGRFKKSCHNNSWK